MESPKDMEQLLEGLRQMQTTNPDVFKQAMQSLGLPTGNDNPSLLEENDSLLKMAEAIKMMKSSGDSGSDIIGGDDLIMSKDKPKQPKGITITPTAGFSFKTTRVSDGLKVFINMAQHELVDEPAIKKKLDDKGEEVEGMNIPMSVGQPHYSEDKKGAKCVVYDIIVNPVVVTEASADKTGKYRDFICQLGMQYLEQKYKEELDKRYKLPKLKYMGSEIATQVIQDRKSMPKIEEVSSKTNKSAAKPSAKTQATKAVAEVPDRDLEYTVSWLVDKEAGEGVGALHYTPGTTELLPDRYANSPYEFQVLEYLAPIHQPTPSTAAIMVSADVPSYELNIPNVQISISPYKVTVKLPGHRKVTVHLACVVQPSMSYYTLRRPYEGCLSSVQVQVVLLVDHADWAETADAGSKAWLLSQALSGSDSAGAEENPYGISATASKTRTATSTAADEDDDDERLAEDKFHLSLPDDVDPYTGIRMEGDDPFSKPRNCKVKPSPKPAAPAPAPVREESTEEQELPEDRFHKKDASSAYLINQREQAKKDKWAKHEKEKLERANDPNVEYVDMEDFRAGGKYGAKETPKEENLLQSAQTEELKRAAEVVATSVGNQSSSGLNLSSSLWTELLD